MKIAKLPKLGKVEPGLVGGVTLVVGIMIFLIFAYMRLVKKHI